MIQSDYITLPKAEKTSDSLDVDDILNLAIEGKISLYHLAPEYMEVPLIMCKAFLLNIEGGFTGFLYSTGEVRKKAEIGMSIEGLYGKEEIVKYSWNIQTIFIKRADLEKLNQPKTDELNQNTHTVVELLGKITTDNYPDNLSSKDKSAITKSINTLKDQIPTAFAFCFKLSLLSMPVPEEGRNEWITYTRLEIESEAAKDGIKGPMAREIYSRLPSVMKK